MSRDDVHVVIDDLIKDGQLTLHIDSDLSMELIIELLKPLNERDMSRASYLGMFGKCTITKEEADLLCGNALIVGIRIGINRWP